jgi:hypothetical protein
MAQTTLLAEEQRAETWASLLARLNNQSVTKHFDAYADVTWDDESYRIDPDDAVWELDDGHPLATTGWYRALPATTRSRIGLHMIASQMKTGLQFESILKRGLLEFAAQLPNATPEFRYAYHEVIEEAQHSLMFQEFVNRSGFDVTGMPPIVKLGARRVIRLGRVFPELFFMFVLGGEDPIDHVQRETLRSGRAVHPLLERIMRIHVTEEARHLSFARNYLKNNVPNLNRARRLALSIETPFILGTMSQLMLRPTPQIVKTYAIPKPVLRDAFSKNPAHHDAVKASLRKVRRLADDLGLVNAVSRPIWKLFGIWEDDDTAASAPAPAPGG